MRLLIISNMAHYYRDGQLVGHGPTVREVSRLAELFESVTHIGCLHSEPAPDLALPYTNKAITFIPLQPMGGPTLSDKLAIIREVPKYLRAILQYLGSADVVHVRAPANIPLIALILLTLVRHPRRRWIKYAGNWKPRSKDALSYRFQRWWLRHDFARAVVTVNGRWDDSPPHIRSFLNPCLTEEERVEGQLCAEQKTLASPLRFVFVGRVEETKGVRVALETIALLIGEGIPAHFDIIGDGPERTRFEETAKDLNVSENVVFHGWKMRQEVNDFYRTAHFILFPSYSEGWPKVLSEAMAYGVVPLASDVSSIPQYLAEFGTGRSLPAYHVQAFCDAIDEYIASPATWKEESRKSVHAARRFSYDAYLEAVQQMLSTLEVT